MSISKLKELLQSGTEENFILARQLASSQNLNFLDACYGKKIPKNVNMYVGTDGAFPANPNSPARTAENWAGTTQFTVLPNYFESFKIVGLDRRKNRVTYKILIDKLYLVDLRDQIVLEILQAYTCAFGEFNGQFCFLSNGSDFKIVGIDTPTFKSVLKYQQDNEQLAEVKNLSVRALEVGGVYFNRSGYSRFIYLGKREGIQTENVGRYLRPIFEEKVKKGHCYLAFRNFRWEDIDTENGDDALLASLIEKAKFGDDFGRPEWKSSPQLIQKVGQWNPEVLDKYFEVMKTAKTENIIPFKALKDVQ